MRPHRSKFSRRPGGSPQAGFVDARGRGANRTRLGRVGSRPPWTSQMPASTTAAPIDGGGGDVLAEHEHRLEHPEDGDHQRECGRPRHAEAAHALVEQDERGDRREDGELADGEPRLRAGVEELRQPALRDGQRQEHQRCPGGAVQAHADRAEPGAGHAADQEVRAEQDRAADEERVAGEAIRGDRARRVDDEQHSDGRDRQPDRWRSGSAGRAGRSRRGRCSRSGPARG